MIHKYRVEKAGASKRSLSNLSSPFFVCTEREHAQHALKVAQDRSRQLDKDNRSLRAQVDELREQLRLAQSQPEFSPGAAHNEPEAQPQSEAQQVHSAAGAPAVKSPAHAQTQQVQTITTTSTTTIVQQQQQQTPSPEAAAAVKQPSELPFPLAFLFPGAADGDFESKQVRLRPWFYSRVTCLRPCSATANSACAERPPAAR